MGGLRQGNEAIAIALRIADVHPPANGIDVPDLKAQALAQAQAEAVEGEEQDAVAGDAGGGEEALSLGNGDDVGQALSARRLDQTGGDPGLVQDVGVVELEAIQIELHGTPGVGADQFGEVVGELLLGEGVDVPVEALADAPDGAGVGIDGLGLKALELEMLEVGLIVVLKGGGGQSLHREVTSWFVIERPLGRGEEATLWIRNGAAVSSA